MSGLPLDLDDQDKAFADAFARACLGEATDSRLTNLGA
jgi:hypothetical protein